MKTIKKVLLIFAAVLCVWGALMLAEHAKLFERRFPDLSQSEEEKQSTLTRAQKAMHGAVEEFCGHEPQNDDSIYAQFRDLSFVDGIYEQFLIDGKPDDDAYLRMHFRKPDGEDMYFEVKYESAELDPYVKETYGKDIYSTFNGHSDLSEATAIMYDIVTGKDTHGFDYEKFAEGAYLSDCKQSREGKKDGKYLILVKGE
ncbi:hypothetical protein [uncultured Ruminococcus sp.]|uniref:hypothetical protein n=1 Tax=uncultured Ruminococcus sp. TaxID=165186 RepID=UPI002626C104|nr:hypothetical protein [uncultured Ruminococcus sp.]